MSTPSTPYRQHLTSPAFLLAAGLVLAVGLWACPETFVGKVKGGLGCVLRPGQVAVGRVREEGRRGATWVRRHFATAAQLQRIEDRNAELEAENRRLAAQLALAESRLPPSRADEEADRRLLVAGGVKARVLGHAARGFLASQHVVDAGSRASVRPEALIVEDLPGLIDQGDNVALASEQLVLSRGRVWGKVVEVGPQTSTVRRVTEPGYRDLVRLATPSDEGGEVRWGPQGIVEGAGEPLARVRLIEVTEPVALGDLVYTAGAKGLLAEPLLYGRIVRLERPVGAAHWEIWMEPAVASNEPETVVVLRTEINPTRLGSLRDRTPADRPAR